jgi:hypothetical protein
MKGKIQHDKIFAVPTANNFIKSVQHCQIKTGLQGCQKEKGDGKSWQ